jgi:hypothetical protein
MTRAVLYVLAGVNGAGKSSIGGHLLERDGLTWFNPDTFARELIVATGCDQETANAHAWQESMRRLDEAIANKVIAERINEAGKVSEPRNELAEIVGCALGNIPGVGRVTLKSPGGSDIVIPVGGKSSDYQYVRVFDDKRLLTKSLTYANGRVFHSRAARGR